MRQGGFNPGNMKELLDYAQNARAYATQQAEAVQQAQAGGGGIGAVMAALGMDYGTDYVKRVDCPSCGGPKKLVSASAYVYCDYCGALADFDFSRACSDASMPLPGPEYARLVNGLQPQLKAALQTGDRESYRALQRQIVEAYAAACRVPYPTASPISITGPIWSTSWPTAAWPTTSIPSLPPSWTK